MYATGYPLPLFAVGACRVAGGGLAIIREPSVQGKLRFSTYTVWHMSLPCGAPYQAPPAGKSAHGRYKLWAIRRIVLLLRPALPWRL